MKVKTSITLSKDILKAVDELSGKYKNRSEFIEVALRTFIEQMIRKEQNARDLEIINRRAEHLNKEALDVLDFQVVL
jgi:Predicted transcriptional regulators containing the CopG/Arc/MetJ DNA-binding domain and a metal-binding domain